MSPDEYRRSLEYRDVKPERCCWNCACYKQDERTCSRMCAASVVNRWEWSWTSFMNDGCGICSGYVSQCAAAIYAGSASAEEAAVKLGVAGEPSVPELDRSFDERRASKKMLDYEDAMLASCIPVLSPAPLEACVQEIQHLAGARLEVEFSQSTSFCAVYGWLRENAPRYEEYMRARFSPKIRLKDMMMRF